MSLLLGLCVTIVGVSPALSANPVKAKASKAETLIQSIRVIQRRPFLKRQRFELQVLGGLGVADSMFRHVSVVANGRFHLNEKWAVGASYQHSFSSESGLLSTVTEDFEVFPERSVIRYTTTVDAEWTPIYGKMAFFDGGVVHFDMYLLFGAGVTQTSRSSSPRVTGTIGVGGRLMLTPWLTMVMELRDNLFVERFNAGNQLINNVMLSLGISLFLPFKQSYKFPK